ncbi:MAG: sulfotransferase domain-containing protein [Thermodesulfobacteriota bacterium]
MFRSMQGIRRRTKRLFNKNQRWVDFIVCGTQKGGTSALDGYLREHPAICMADQKEVHFFDDEKRFRNNNMPDYSAYHAFFHPGPAHERIGETTPVYMYWQDAPRRIWQYNPRMKLIVMLRNPIERAYSHWNMEHARKADSLSFGDAIRNERKRCRQALPYQHRICSYISRGFYLEQLRRLYQFFPEENVLVLKNEQLRYHPRQTLETVCRFLQVSSFAGIRIKEVHSRPYASEMGAGEKEYLRKVFEYEIRGIERELGWDCSDWLSG